MCDKWQPEQDLVNIPSPCLTSEGYDLHQDLALRIKPALTGKRKCNPVVRIDMPFGSDVFCQGLQLKRILSRVVKGLYKLLQDKQIWTT